MKRIHTSMIGILFAAATTFAAPLSAEEYREAPVPNGGTIRGKVILNGSKPAPRVFPLVLYPFGPFCKRISDGNGNVILQEFLVDDDGGLRDAVVALEGVTSGKPFPELKLEMTAEDCMFHPSDADRSETTVVGEDGRVRHEHPVVAVFRNHAPISIVNRDPIIHNGQVFQSERGNIVLNFPLPVSTHPNGGPIHFDTGKRIAQLICGMHEFMQNWGYVVNNPYYAKTQRDGEFIIGRVPPGTYRLTAWHPHLKPIMRQVTVRPNEAAEVVFEFDSSEVKFPHYESQERFRIGPEAHRHESLTADEKERFMIK
jgi:hypothetical protein